MGDIQSSRARRAFPWQDSMSDVRMVDAEATDFACDDTRGEKL